jgi:hypothetical protein
MKHTMYHLFTVNVRTRTEINIPHIIESSPKFATEFLIENSSAYLLLHKTDIDIFTFATQIALGTFWGLAHYLLHKMENRRQIEEGWT